MAMKGCHQTRERDGKLREEGGHAADAPGELLVAVNGKQESSHEADKCDTPIWV